MNRWTKDLLRCFLRLSLTVKAQTVEGIFVSIRMACASGFSKASRREWMACSIPHLWPSKVEDYLRGLYASRQHTSSVAIKLVNFANDLKMSFDVDLNDVRMRLYSFASNSEGPWLLCLHGRSTYCRCVNAIIYRQGDMALYLNGGVSQRS